MDITFSKDNVKNPAYNSDGHVDLEVKHPEHGWIPYTLDMSDKDETLDNNRLKSVVDTMSIAEYVEPEIEGEEASADIIGSL